MHIESTVSDSRNNRHLPQSYLSMLQGGLFFSVMTHLLVINYSYLHTALRLSLGYGSLLIHHSHRHNEHVQQ